LPPPVTPTAHAVTKAKPTKPISSARAMIDDDTAILAFSQASLVGRQTADSGARRLRFTTQRRRRASARIIQAGNAPSFAAGRSTATIHARWELDNYFEVKQVTSYESDQPGSWYLK
jgi:hypothetical protein